MPTPCFDLACEAMKLYCEALRDPQSSPAKIEAHHKAVKLALVAARANFANETEALDDCEKIAKSNQLIKDAKSARMDEERRLGLLILEYEREHGPL
jgi:hypothetical protein